MSDEARKPLAEAVRQLAARRREAQPPLTPEEILGLARGELEDARRQEVAERLSVEPEATQALLDVHRFPVVEPLAEGHQLGEFELEAQWRRLHGRLEREGRLSRVRPFASRALPLAVAALLVLTLGLGGWVVSLRQQVDGLRGPRPNPEVISLLPEDGTVRALAGDGEATAAGGRLVLILNHGGSGAQTDFRLDVNAPDGPTLFTVEGLERRPLGNFTVELPTDLLPPGEVQLVLFGLTDGRWEPLDSYRVRIGAEPIP